MFFHNNSLHKKLFYTILFSTITFCISCRGFQQSPPLDLTMTTELTPFPVVTKIEEVSSATIPPIFQGTLAYLNYPGVEDNKAKITLINLENKNIQALEFDCYFCSSFSISPDGSQVLMVGFKDFSNRMILKPILYGMHEQQSDFNVLFSDSLECEEYATWSPDGTYILYTKGSDPCKSGSDVAILELNTLKSYQLTTTPGIEIAPSWSPDGKFIAYGYQEPSHTPVSNLNQEALDTFVWIMDSDGKNPYRTSYLPVEHNLQISWSPDSKMIVFSSPYKCGVVYSLDILSKKTKVFYRSENGCASHPVWSPDGENIAFLIENVNSSQGWQILIRSKDGINTFSVASGNLPSPLHLAWTP